MAYSNGLVYLFERRGTVENPYTDMVENLTITYNRVFLYEVPDKYTRVTIKEWNVDKTDFTLYSEVDFLDDIGTPTSFYVDYEEGYIHFHPLANGRPIEVLYKGTGVLLYPATRIYLEQDNGKGLPLTLQEFADKLDKAMADVNQLIIDTNEAMSKLIEETTEKADKLVSDTTEKTDKLISETSEKLDREIADFEDEKNVIRENENERIIAENDRVLAEQERASLDSTREKRITDAEDAVADVISKTKDRVLVFAFPYPNSGENNLVARFPFNGQIMEVKGILYKNEGEALTEINIEKSSDFNNWLTIFANDTYLTFNANENLDNESYVLGIKDVTAEDMFRVNIRSISENAEGLSIEIRIRLYD